MIIFNGISPINSDISIIRFRNENDDKIDIPIDNATARTISMYLEKIKTVPTKTVEEPDDEETF